VKNTLKIMVLVSLIPINSLAFEQIEVNVSAGGQHEECFYVDNGISITYQYKTSSPLDFNLHYHDDNGMNYLVELPKSSSNSNSVEQLVQKQVYCLMWINPESNKAELNYEFKIK